MSLIYILFGVALLLMGRQLFWVFVAVVGFLYGFEVAALIFPAPVSLPVVLIALGGGVVGAIMAVLLQPLAAGVSGFLAGGYILSSLFYGPHWQHAESSWILFVAGGVVGFIAVIALFDWALIVLSSLIGAVLILQYFDLSSQLRALAAVALLIIGILIQSRTLEESVVKKI